MKTGKCPKCGSSEIYCQNKMRTGRSALMLSVWSVIPLDEYVCGDCGYVESFVSDAKSLSKLTEKLEKARKD